MKASKDTIEKKEFKIHLDWNFTCKRLMKYHYLQQISFDYPSPIFPFSL